MSSLAERSPFHKSAAQYYDRGWSPIPLPLANKWPPPKGFTGNHGELVSEQQLEMWLSDNRPRNLALVLADGQVAFDVDGKAAMEHLAELEAKLGPLPRGWTSNRGNKYRYHQPFRVQCGHKFKGELAKNFDIVQPTHRYMVAPPSIHPDTKKNYHWFTPNGRMVDTIPYADDIPDLSDLWTKYTLTTNNNSTVKADIDTESWLRKWGAGTMCDGMKSTLYKARRAIYDGIGDGFHPALRDGLMQIIGDIHNGHAGANSALRRFKRHVFACMTRRSESQLEGEWDRAFTGAVKLVAGRGKPMVEQHMCGIKREMHVKVKKSVSDNDDLEIAEVCMADVEPLHTDWIWADRIPCGEITLVTAQAGTGKSTFSAWLAAEITRGNLPGMYAGKKRSVAIIASEESANKVISPRLIAAGADSRYVHDISKLSNGDRLVIPDHLDVLERFLLKRKVGLLILDPLNSILASYIDTNKGSDVRSALEKFREVLERTNTACIGIKHFNKAHTMINSNDRIAGSTEFINVARASMFLAVDKDAEDLTVAVTQTKNNLGSMQLPTLAFALDIVMLPPDETGHHVKTAKIRWISDDYHAKADDLVAQRHVRGPDLASTGLSRTILDVLQGRGEPMRYSEFGQLLDAKSGSIKSALSRMVKGGLIIRVGKGEYTLPEQVDTGDSNE